MSNVPVTVAEAPGFLKKAERHFSESEYEGLVFYLASNPEAGGVMPETGGVRKIRWAVKGRGKSGGVRVIYYFHNETMPLVMIDLFAKNEKANLSRAERSAMRALIPEIVRQYSRKGK